MAEWLFPRGRQSWERHTLHRDAGWLAACRNSTSCFCLVKAIKLNIVQIQLTWPLPTTRLGSLLAQRSRACTLGSFLKSSGHKPNSAASSFLLLMIGVQQCAGFSWWSLEGLLTAPQNWPILPPEGSCELGSLLTYLS